MDLHVREICEFDVFLHPSSHLGTAHRDGGAFYAGVAVAALYFLPNIGVFSIGAILSATIIVGVSYLYSLKRFMGNAAEFKRANLITES